MNLTHAVCKSKDTCPRRTAKDGSALVAADCTSAALVPRQDEGAKRFGCFCGGVDNDVFTANICGSQQPHTNWMFELLPAIAGSAINQTNFTMSMYERAGTPANVRSAAPHALQWRRVREGECRASNAIARTCRQ